VSAWSWLAGADHVVTCPAASLPTSVEELRALVVELWEANACPREVIAAQDHQIVAADRGVGAAAG
jgi:hypothetical protein